MTRREIHLCVRLLERKNAFLSLVKTTASLIYSFRMPVYARLAIVKECGARCMCALAKQDDNGRLRCVCASS
jgi:hypothetical protein